jgi:hypothetical protein
VKYIIFNTENPYLQDLHKRIIIIVINKSNGNHSNNNNRYIGLEIYPCCMYVGEEKYRGEFGGET